MEVANDQFYKQGAIITLENSKSLLKISDVSAKEGEFGIALSLTILASEEAVKSILIMIKYTNSEVVIDDFEEIFNSHKNKHKHLRMFTLVNRLTMRQREENFGRLKIRFDKFETLCEADKTELKEKYSVIFKQYEWFKKQKEYQSNLQAAIKWWNNANMLKNKGFYVGKENNKWKNPKCLSEKDYLEGRKHATAIIDYVTIFNEMVEWSNKNKINNESKL